ncbi:MAG: hypothetical protein OHK0029_22020 [Armatimonadaceae bacterium]
MVTLRRLTEDDAEELAPMAGQTFIDGWASVIGREAASGYVAEYLHPERLRAEIQNPTNYFAGAFDTETSAIAGYARLDYGKPAPECVSGRKPVVLQRLYVAAAFRGAGVADSLLNHCREIARQGGFDTLWLETDPRNERAWRFYEKRGFVAVGYTTYRYPDGENPHVRILVGDV